MKKLTRKDFLKTCVLAVLSVFHLPAWLRGKEAAPAAGSRGAQTATPEQEKMIAFCGIGCSECPTFIATQKNDDKMREETAKKWSEMFNAEIKPGDINCDGCTSQSSRLFDYCGKCEIRKCGKEKNVKNCAYCDEYPCEKLSAFLKNVPEAKATLDEIRGLIHRC
ncbi:MAG: DUF3795 domain-containing protein [Candidatus Aminicenantes bacterium]|nr:DUF3795 domain-containing protein [Candidatus Aminicenantes bacterium]